MRRGLRVAVVAAAAAGCGPDSTAGDGDDSTTSSGTSSGADEESGASTGSPGVFALAEDIRVDFVEVNEGIGVRVGDNGEGVPPVERTAFLPANRIALVRAFWRVNGDFVPREIKGELDVTFADGSKNTYIDTKTVSGDSFAGDLNETFNWGLMEFETQPGMTYSVALYETEPASEGYVEPAESNARLPNDGSEAFVGIENSYMLLKVVLVPFNYDNGGNCVTEPDTSEPTMQVFQDLMFQMNPIDKLEFEVHESVQWDTPLDSFFELNSYMSDLRFQEGALPETYYFGLVDVCSGGLGDAGGLAHGIPADPTSMDAAYQRVSSGLWIDTDWSAETFVHEVGHSQGRLHVGCDGEGGIDPTYPIPGGDVGEWGFGVVDFQLRHPTFHKDYMTYCHPTWVSTFGWNKVYPTILALSMWDAGFPGAGGIAPEPGYSGSLLVGAVLPNGKELWQTVPGGIDSSELDSGTQIEFGIANRVVATTGARVEILPDGAGEVMIVAPLPEGFDAVSRLTRLSGGKRFEIDRSEMRLAHHARTIRAR